MATERESQLADFAHLVLSVARDIRLGTHVGSEVIEVSGLESLVMDYIEHNPGVSPTRICAEIGLRSSNTSAVLRSLEVKNLIRREPDPDDGRSVRVHPTDVSACNVERVRAQWSRLLAPHVDSSTDISAAIDVLRRVDCSITHPSGDVLASHTD